MIFHCLRVLYFLCEERQVLGHLREVLDVEGFGVGFSVDVVLGLLFFGLLASVVHEGVELFDVNLPPAEVDILVK